MTDLTEQWKKGELSDGYYYCKLILNNMKPSVERCKAHCIPMGVSADKGEEVLAPVPSYEEWKELIESEEKSHLQADSYYNKILELKDLLKEVKYYLPEFETPMDILAKIDEALQ